MRPFLHFRLCRWLAASGFLLLLLTLPALQGQIQAQTYCTTNLYNDGCIWGDDINSFIFGSFQKLNTTCPAGGYHNFTSDTIEVNQGLTYSVSMNSNYSCCQYFAIWIDLNGDGDFDDAGEFLWASTVDNQAALQFVSGEVTIPINAPLGTTRLRVRGKYAGPPITAGQSCTQFFYGETHDYTIVINPAPPCFPPTLTGVTDITNNSAVISYAMGPDALGIDLQYGPAGFSLGNGTIVSPDSSPYTLTGLSQNTTYDVYIQADCPDNEVSGWFGPLTFTTIPDNVVMVTYTDGDIPTMYQLPVTTADISTCAGSMTVQIPAGFWITGVDIWYDMTATGGAFMSEAFSRLLAPAYGVGETQYYSGIGAGGTFSYNRNNLSQFNGLFGEIEFVLDAKRNWGNLPDCGVNFNYVVNNTWTMMIALDTIPDCVPPIGLTASNISESSAQLSWTAADTSASWEVVVQAAGGGTPVGAGVVSATTTYSASNLDPNTAYEFWVREDCGADGYSTWSGPYTFQTLCVPLAPGSYTLGGPGADFPDFTELVYVLQCGGITGSVVINVTSGMAPFNEQIIIGQIPGAGPSATVTINGNDNTLQYLSTNFEQRATLKMMGTSWVTIKNLNIVALGLTTAEYGFTVQLMDNAQYITFDSVTVEANITSNSLNYAAFVASNSHTSATFAGMAANNITVTNSTIKGGYYGLVLSGPSSGTGMANNYIANNNIHDFHLYGLYLRGQENGTFDRNDISRPNRTSTGTIYMLYLNGGMAGCMFTNNTMHNPLGMATNNSSFVYPIYGTSTSGTEASPMYFINNMIYNINTQGGIWGVYFLTTNVSHYRFYHNTISLSNNAATASSIRAFSQTTAGSNIELKNNIFHVEHSGTGIKHLVYFSPAPTNYSIDYNALSMQPTGGSNHIGFMGSDLTTMTAWQNAGNDENGLAANPYFMDPNGDLLPQTGAIATMGTNLNTVAPFDYFGTERPASPSAGAIQFSPPSCAPPLNFSAITTDVSATISWIPNSPFVAFNYQVGPTGFALGSVSTQVTVQTTIEVTGLTPETTYDIYVQTICGLGDNSTWAGPFTFSTLCDFLPAGTYTLGNASADFTDFTDLAEYLECGGIAGPVIINVIPGSGPFEEQFKLNAINGSSEINTLTINGNGNTLTFNPTISGDRATIRFNGTSYVIIDSLNISTTTTGTFGFGVHLLNEAHHVTFNNCTITAGVTSTGIGVVPFAASNSETSATIAGNAAHNITVTNCVIIGGYYGLALNGPTSGAFALNNHIANNTIRDFYLYGLYLRGQEDAVIDRNDIYRDQRANITTFYGMYVTNNMPGSVFSNNRIHNPKGNVALSTTATVYGFYFVDVSGTETKPYYMINNQLYNMNTNGTVYGSYAFGTNNHYRWYHNTFSLVNTQITGFSTARGLWLGSSSDNAQIRNNIIHLKWSGTSQKHNIYLSNPGVGITINNNALSNESIGGQAFIGFSGGNITSFADWQTAGYDADGVGGSPFFLDEMSDLVPQSSALKGIGADFTAVAPEDFNGVLRPTTPDPGAFQFEPADCLPVSGIAAMNISQDGATITWVESGSSTSWDIELVSAGTSPTGVPTDSGVVSPYVITGLSALTSYDVYVRADCGDGEYSSWSGPLTFNTLCADFFLPFFEGFDGLSVQCWSFPEGQGNWQFGSTYTPPSSTSGGPNAWFSFSPTLTNYSHSLTSPVFDVTDSENTIMMDFKLFLNNFSTATINYMHVEYKTVEDTVWTELQVFGSDTLIGAPTNTIEFVSEFQVLEDVAGSKFQVRFRAAGSDSWNLNGWGLDDVYIRETSPCIAPLNLTVSDIYSDSMVVSWTVITDYDSFFVEYGPAGFTPGTGTMLVVDTTFVGIGGLTPQTSYHVYVQTDCGGSEGLSLWEGPFNVNTLCLPLPGGTYTLGDSLADFLNFTEFFYSLECGGIGGPVIVNVIPGSGPFTEQIIAGVIYGTSEVNTITINGNDNTIQYLSLNNLERATIRLKGSSRITFNDLNIVALGDGFSEYGYAVQLSNNAQYITFDNCLMQASPESTSTNQAAFVMSNDNFATSIGLSASFITVKNSELVGGYYGATIGGPTVAPFAQSNVFENNVIRDFYLYGMFIRGQENGLFDRNDVSRSNRQSISTFYGIYATSGLPGTMFTNNTIHNPLGLAAPTTLSAYPFYFTGAFGTTTAPYYLINNQVYNINLNGIQYGVYMLGACDHFRLYHNSISMANQNSLGTSTIAAYYQLSFTTNAEVKNNIFHVEAVNSATKYCAYVSSNSSVVAFDNNVMSMASTSGTNNTGFFGSVAPTFAAWQLMGHDANGSGNNPMFVNPVFNLIPQSGQISNLGMDLTAIAPLDFNGVVRDTNPDPGAFEFEPSDCLAPSGLMASNITQSGATLTWTDNADATTWDIEIGPAGFTPTGTPTDSAITQPFVVTGLNALTTYHVYVRAHCDEGEFSLWAGPFSFTTACASFTLPFFEGFGGLSQQCWSFPEGQANWAFGAVYTPPGSTSGPPNAWFSWTPSIQNYNHSLTSPIFNAVGEAGMVMLDYRLYLNNFGLTAENMIIVQYKTVGASSWNSLNTHSSYILQGTSDWEYTWVISGAELPGMAGNEFQVRFMAAGEDSYFINGWGLDDVHLYLGASDCPAIVAPVHGSTGVCASELTLMWDTVGAMNFDLYFGTAADPLLLAAGITGGEYVVSDLAPGTVYYWSVVPDGNADSTSSCAVMSFTTVMPIEITIDGSTELCEGETVTLTGPPGFVSYEWTNQRVLWDFNNSDFEPVSGNGELFAIGGVTTSFVSGSLDGGSSDPTTGTNSALNTTNYPAQGTENHQRGIQINVSTEGIENIMIQWDHRFSNTAANAYTVQYTPDRNAANVEWNNVETLVITPENPLSNWYNYRTVDMSGISAVNNNPNVAFRIVASFDPGAGQYLAVNSNNNYGPNGTARYDMVKVWGSSSSQSITVGQGGTYVLTAVDSAGCVHTASVDITVIPAPFLEVSASVGSVCEGESVTLTATGDGVSYEWSGGVQNNEAFTPTQTATYYVTATDAEGCTAVDSITIPVNPYPTVVAGASSTEICEGEVVILTGSGADSYEWSDGAENNQPILITQTTTFTVTGTSNGCSSTDEITITVLPAPSTSLDLDINEEVCDSADPFTLTGGNPAGGTYSGPGVTGNVFNPAAAGVGTHVITYTYSDNNGCSNTAQDSFTVVICPNVRDVALQHVDIYPNPFNNFVDVTWRQLPAVNAEIRVIDMLGRIVTLVSLDDQQTAAGTFRLQLDQLAAGTYMIEMRSGLAVHSQTLIKAQ